MFHNEKKLQRNFTRILTTMDEHVYVELTACLLLLGMTNMEKTRQNFMSKNLSTKIQQSLMIPSKISSYLLKLRHLCKTLSTSSLNLAKTASFLTSGKMIFPFLLNVLLLSLMFFIVVQVIMFFALLSKVFLFFNV